MVVFLLLSDSISIHALRGEGDVSDKIKQPDNMISIHALRGEGDVCGTLKTI